MNRLKDPLFTSFWIYLGKVIYMGMNLYDAIFMASLVAIHAYQEHNAHKERLKKIEEDVKMAARVLTMERNYDSLKTKLDELASAAYTGIALTKRR